ncbi:MAG: site-2 protease family protein [Desulfurivibrionaceae bacterium]|nr:site-2 protease family protein [Desulfurivibrionaceae bacterium]
MINNIIQQIAIMAPPFLLAITFHEFCHGYVAWRLGDPTAKNAGRLTMNPLKHLDPLGVLAFIIMRIGWAKPVPVNATYFRNPVKDMMWVAVAGPVANLALALGSAVAMKLLVMTEPFVPNIVLVPLYNMVAVSIWFNLVLCIFNLLPIPPLDGSRILAHFLPLRSAMLFYRLEPFGFIILLLLFYLGIIPKLIMPLTSFAHNLITG